jgi:hypothetical protein
VEDVFQDFDVRAVDNHLLGLVGEDLDTPRADLGAALELSVLDVETLKISGLDGLEIQESLNLWLTAQAHGAADWNDFDLRLFCAPDQGQQSRQNGQRMGGRHERSSTTI